MARYYRVARLDDGRPSSFRVEWTWKNGGAGSFEVNLDDRGAAMVSLQSGQNSQSVVQLDPEERAALRRFLSEAERAQT